MRVLGVTRYADLAPHKGHSLTVEADDITANLICDECGETVASATADPKVRS